MRLFVALDLPDAAVGALARFRDAAADPAVWRPLDATTFHVTLAFLGQRLEEDVAEVGAVLAGLADREPPVLALGDGLLLPPRRARALTVALVDATGALGALRAEIAAGLAAAGVFAPEPRPFRPHVTVARLRSGARASRTVGADVERLAFAAGAVVLYRSHLGRGGAIYEPLDIRTR